MAKSAAAASPPAAPNIPVSRKSASTVTVACKFPAGLVLQLHEPRTERVMANGTSFERVVHDKVGGAIVIQGPGRPNGPIPRGYPKAPQMAGGYALTKGIPRDFWEAWLAQNKDSDLVKTKTIFAAETPSLVVGQAKEQRAVLTGFEPLNPDGDYRVPKPIGAGLTPVEMADEMKARQATPEMAEDEADE